MTSWSLVVGMFGRMSSPQDKDILKMKAACSIETLVPIYEITRCYNKQDGNMNPHCHESLRCYSLTCLSTLSHLLFLKREAPLVKKFMPMPRPLKWSLLFKFSDHNIHAHLCTAFRQIIYKKNSESLRKFCYAFKHLKLQILQAIRTQNHNLITHSIFTTPPVLIWEIWK